MEMATLLAVGELITKYGVPAALSVAATWAARIDTEPTEADIERLREMVPEPSVFFEVPEK